MKRESVHFTVDARLITQLGEQLVPSAVMALAELAKNAYDADAQIVLIDHMPEGEGTGLRIEDDGLGMTEDQFRKGWLRIGTALKEKEEFSPKYGRPRAGRKGIGRFAVQRLGTRIKLWTTPAGSPYAIELEIDWQQFRPDEPLEAVETDLRISAHEAAAQGTRIQVSGLTHEWTPENLKEVLEDLVRLQSPEERDNKGLTRPGAKEPDPGFSVLVSIQGSELQRDIDETDLLRDERAYTVSGQVGTDGAAGYQIDFHRPPGEAIEEGYSRPLATGPFSFSVDVFVYQRGMLAGLNVGKAKELGKRHGGCRIWRDGFRVFPYGEPGDDWLKLDEHVGARRPPLTMPRNMNLFGGIRITAKDNPQFVDLLTRRGVVETEAFADLREFVFHAIKIGATEHGALTVKEHRGGKARSTPSEETRRAVEAVRRQRKERLLVRLQQWHEAEESGKLTPETVASLQEDAKQEQRTLTSAEDELQETVEESERELLNENAMLRVLASLGTGLATYAHELRMVGKGIGIAAQEIEGLCKGAGCPREKRVREKLEEVHGGVSDLAAYRKYIDGFIQVSARRRRQAIELKPALQELLRTFSGFLAQRSVRIHMSVPRGLFVRPMHRAELNSVFFNLLTNATKALLTPGVQERDLLFIGSRQDEWISIVVADKGCGIPGTIVDRIFEPFVTRSHVGDDEALGQGTGLGLYIVREIVEENGGTVAVSLPPAGYTTALEVKLPARPQT